MKQLNSFVITLLLGAMLLITGCSTGPCREQLLSTIPSDAEATVMINLGSILSKTDSKVDGSKLVLSTPMRHYLGSMGLTPDAFDALEQGVLGIDLNFTAVFMHKGRVYFTCLFDDPDSFIEVMQSAGGKVKSDNGWTIIEDDDIAMYLRNKQMWMCLDGRVTLDDVAYFFNLDKKNSMLAADIARIAFEDDDDITAIIDSKVAMYDNPMAFSTMAGAIDARYLIVDVDIEDYEIKIEAKPYTAKCEPVKFDFDFKPINIDCLKRLQGQAQIVAAVDFPADALSGLLAMASMGAPAEIRSLLNSLDGTIGVDVSLTDADGNMVSTFDGNTLPPFSCVAQCKSAQSASAAATDLSSALSGYADFSATDNFILGNTPTMTGQCAMDSSIDSLRGAFLGIAWSAESLSGQLPKELYDVLKSGYIVIKMDDGELKFECEWKFGVQKPLLAILALNLASVQGRI